MRVFNKPNTVNDWFCPICGSSKEKEVVLISKVGTQEGNISEAEQFHLDCLEPMYDKTLGVIYQKLTIQGDQ